VGKFVAALGGVLAALTLCCCAAANLIVGINDDARYEASASSFFMPAMSAEGLKLNALTIRWDETAPDAIDPDLEEFVTEVISSAQAAGITIELDLYPLHSRVFTDGVRCAPSTSPLACGDTARIRQFAAWTATIAADFPSVRQFIVMNECNQPLFVNPQWNTAGGNQSAAICGRALAAAYDALKAMSSSNFVWGIGLSPRGNDSPGAVSNSSTSPVRFLGDLGRWFRSFAAATGRTAPLMDGLDFHPYPVPQSLPFATGYPNPMDATVTNLPRIYQAFYDGFDGTPQRTIGQQAGGGLPVSLNELGIQTDETSRLGYVNHETSAGAAGGVDGADASQSYQASYYAQTLAFLACDPNVRQIDIYHLVDDPDLAGWQSGLYAFSPGTPIPKESAAVVGSYIAATHGACQGQTMRWRPSLPLAAAAGAPRRRTKLRYGIIPFT
jgi:hypothetical protein